MKQSINGQLTNKKKQALNILIFLKLLLQTQMVWITFTKILKNEIQIKNAEY